MTRKHFFSRDESECRGEIVIIQWFPSDKIFLVDLGVFRCVLWQKVMSLIRYEAGRLFHRRGVRRAKSQVAV